MKKKKKNNNNLIAILPTLLITIFLISFLGNIKNLLKLPTNTFIVEDGTVSYEENAVGFIIRDEEVLKGEEYKNGMVQIKLEGEKVAKGENVFRYYSNGEDEIKKQISDLSDQISEALSNSENTIFNSDISNIDKQIEKCVNELNKQNDLEKIKEIQKKIENYMTKKSQIAGEKSPAGSYIKQLIEQKNELQNRLTQNAINIVSPESGIVSYRVDGLENILTTGNFEYLTNDLLNGFESKAGGVVPQSTEEGKIVNNFVSYIACFMDTDTAMEAKVNDKVKIKLSNAKQIDAKIIEIKEEENGRIIVFEIKDQIESLIEYRKISFDIVWWKYDGWKVSNTALIEENDLYYVERKKTNYNDRIPVKILRQNSTYSIVTNYTDEELEQLGFSVEEIEKMPKIKIYDEILLH